MSDRALRRRPRHWKQRFDPAADFIFRKRVTLGDGERMPGDPVPKDISARNLRKFWRTGRIELAHFENPNVRTGKTGAFDPASRIEMLVDAIAGLDPNQPALFTSTGKPRVEVLEDVVGFPITAAERDEAFAEWQLRTEPQG